MPQPYVGEIRLFAGSFAPAGWLFCDGALLPISENETLFQLIGTTYGGDGENTFALPDLRGRVPLHFYTGTPIASAAGVETVSLTAAQMPAHSHAVQATVAPGSQPAAGPANLLGASSTMRLYSANTPNSSLGASAMDAAGGGQPHENRQPYQAVQFIISLFGIFPSPS